MKILFRLKHFLFIILYEIKHIFLFINTLLHYKKLNLTLKLAYLDFKINYIYNSHKNYDVLKIFLKRFFFSAEFKNKINFFFYLDKIKIKNNDSLIKKINQLPIRKSIIFLKNLLYYYQLFGCLENCLTIRKIYRRKLINLQKKDVLINLDALRACLEVNRPDLVLYFYKNKKCKYFDKKKVFEIFQFANLLKKNIYKINKKNYFNKLISNKNILIKGPNPESYKKNLYINEEFVHISMNAMGEKRNYNSISYYSGSRVSNFSNKIINAYPNLLFSCFKTKEGTNLILNKYYEKKTRIFYNVNNILLNKYGANLTQNIIYDLLLYNPKKILLIGINFFLKKNYYKNYKSNFYSKKKMACELRIHDPFSNFLFVQNLFKRGFICASIKVQRILNLKDEIYAKKLNKQYRQFIL